MLDTSVEHKFVGDRYHIFLRKGKCKVRAKRGQLGDRHVTRRSLHDSRHVDQPVRRTNVLLRSLFSPTYNSQ